MIGPTLTTSTQMARHSGSMRGPMQLLSPVWEEYVPPPFCGNKIDPILAATKLRKNHETQSLQANTNDAKGIKSYNYDTNENEIDVTTTSTSAARNSLFALLREKLLKWCRPRVSSIHIMTHTRKPVEVSRLIRKEKTQKKSTARRRNNNNNNNTRRSVHHRQWTMESMNPLTVLAKLPEAYVNMMNGIAKSPAFSGSGMATSFPAAAATDTQFPGRDSHHHPEYDEELVVELLQQLQSAPASSIAHGDTRDYSQKNNLWHN